MCCVPFYLYSRELEIDYHPTEVIISSDELRRIHGEKLREDSRAERMSYEYVNGGSVITGK